MPQIALLVPFPNYPANSVYCCTHHAMGPGDAEQGRFAFFKLHFPMLQVAFFICHFAACMFYFIARQYGFSDTTWIGANAAEVLDGKSTFLRCECPTRLVTGLSKNFSLHRGLPQPDLAYNTFCLRLLLAAKG